ncbi:MAG: hypothetical protein HYX78_14025 [Armatimonadetes bacterium]|nr:hypothetical protein [Armatimonadota bacterium]
MSIESTIEQLKEKLNKALMTKAVLQERSKRLAEQVQEYKRREDQNDHVVNEMLDRQRELAFMLHRANSVLHRLQETNSALSAEFSEFVKELPEPSTPDWEQRVAKINDLFKKTGDIADEMDIFREGPETLEAASPVESLISAKPDDPPPSEEPSLSAEVVGVEPAAAAETVADPQPEIIEQSTPAEPEPEPETEEPAVESVFCEADSEPATTHSQEKIEQLFVHSSGSEQDSSSPEPESADARTKSRPGVFSRLWRRMTGRGEKGISVTPTTLVVEDEPVIEAEEDTDLPLEPASASVAVGADLVDSSCDTPDLPSEPGEEPADSEEPAEQEAEEMVSVAEDLHAGDDEEHVGSPSEDFHIQAVGPASYSEPAQAVDDLWDDDAARDLETVSMDIIPPSDNEEEPVEREPEETNARRSIWSRMGAALSSAMERQSLEAVERARARRSKRLHRRLGRPDGRTAKA